MANVGIQIWKQRNVCCRFRTVEGSELISLNRLYLFHYQRHMRSEPTWIGGKKA
jgi:hypothetical protein